MVLKLRGVLIYLTHENNLGAKAWQALVPDYGLGASEKYLGTRVLR